MPPKRPSRECPVCHRPFSSWSIVDRHMIRCHPTEWANTHPGEQLTYYRCDFPGCNKLPNNHWPNIYEAHISRVHGIDSPAMKRTTVAWYLESKNMDILQMHVLQEATELNKLNSKIRDIEDCFALDPPAGGYTSCHGFDLNTNFDTSVPHDAHKKASWVTYLQQIRNARNAVGSLYTRPGVMDTRDGVFDDLRSLLDTPDVVNPDDLESPQDTVVSRSDSPKAPIIHILTPEEAFALLRQESAQGWWARITGQQI